MVRRCVAYKCDNNSKNRRGSSVSFHQFPTDPNQKDVWIAATKRINISSKSAVLCSTHFEKSCFEYRTGSAQLKKDAIPTIFTFPPDCSPERNPKRKRALISESTMTNTEESDLVSQEDPKPHSKPCRTTQKKVDRTSICSKIELDLLKRMRPIRPHPGKSIIENLPLLEPEIVINPSTLIGTTSDPLHVGEFENFSFVNRAENAQLNKDIVSSVLIITPECNPERNPRRIETLISKPMMTNNGVNGILVSQADIKISSCETLVPSQKKIIQTILCSNSSTSEKKILKDMPLLNQEVKLNTIATNLNPSLVSDNLLNSSATKSNFEKIPFKRKKFTYQNSRYKRDILSSNKVRRKWTVATATNKISAQRRKIALLLNANRRLRSRVKDLKSLVVTHLL